MVKTHTDSRHGTDLLKSCPRIVLQGGGWASMRAEGEPAKHIQTQHNTITHTRVHECTQTPTKNTGTVAQHAYPETTLHELHRQDNNHRTQAQNNTTTMHGEHWHGRQGCAGSEAEDASTRRRQTTTTPKRTPVRHHYWTVTERQEGDKSGQEDTPTRRRYTTKTLMGTWTRRHCRTTTRWQKRDKSRAEDTLTGRQGTTKTPSDTMTNCHYRVGQACHMRPPQDDRQDSEREEEREKGGPCSYGELSCSYGQTRGKRRDGRKGKGTTGRQKGGKGCKAGREEGARKYGREATAGITMKRAVRTREGNEQQRQGRNSGLGRGGKGKGEREGRTGTATKRPQRYRS